MVDFDRWQSGYPWAGCTNKGTGELQCYTPDAVRVADGVLRITADRRDAASCAQQPPCSNLPFSSGMLNSSPSFAQRYGYFEMRARVPGGQGIWPAFWLLPKPIGTWPPELDIMELLGHEPNRVQLSQHYYDLTGAHRKRARSWSGPDFTDGFHTYALSWSQDAIVWYVDGIERFRSTTRIPREEMYVLVNLAVGGDWPGAPDVTTEFPSVMEVDYIRVWEDPHHRTTR